MAGVAMETDQSQWDVVFLLSQTFKFSALRSAEEHCSADLLDSLVASAESNSGV